MKANDLMRRMGCRDSAKRMMQTEPGRLATMLGELLYNSDTREIEAVKGAEGHRIKRWITSPTTYDVQDGVRRLAKETAISTSDVLREIHDYLEALAFIEVYKQEG